jgi:hypothetical protein
VQISQWFARARLFDPLVLSKPDRPCKSLTFATALGGTKWPGGSYDPETHTVYASANQQDVGLGVLPVTNRRFSARPNVGSDALAGLRDVQGHSGDGPRLNRGRAPERPIASDDQRTECARAVCGLCLAGPQRTPENVRSAAVTKRVAPGRDQA